MTAFAFNIISKICWVPLILSMQSISLLVSFECRVEVPIKNVTMSKKCQLEASGLVPYIKNILCSLNSKHASYLSLTSICQFYIGLNVKIREFKKWVVAEWTLFKFGLHQSGKVTYHSLNLNNIILQILAPSFDFRIRSIIERLQGSPLWKFPRQLQCLKNDL